MTRRRRLTILTAAILVAAGGIAGLALSKDGASPVQPGWSRTTYTPKPGSVRIELRAKDPAGDAPWVVRAWITRDNTQACEQLGREVNGIVGDVTLDGRFRPLRFGERTVCSPRVLDRRSPIVQVATFVDDPLANDPKPLRTVAWGIAGPRAEKVTVDAPGGLYTAPSTPWRGWLDVRAGDVPTYKMVTKIRYGGGSIRTIDYGSARRPSRHPLAGTVTVDARVDSPNGGPDYGLLMWRTENGSICSANGRMIGADRVGAWDPRGSFFDFPIGEGAACNLPANLTREQPFAASLGFQWGNSKLMLTGVAIPDVEKVVVDAPGTKRELTPGPHGGVLALIDNKSSGRVHLKVVFKDGTTKEVPGFPLRRLRAGAGRLPHISAVGPRTVPVTRRGSFTLEVSCSAHPSNRKCMSGLYVRSAETFRQKSGLSYRVQMAGRIVRTRAGVKNRRLRLHLSRRGLALLERERRVPVVISDSYEGGGKHSFRVLLVQQGLAARSARTVTKRERGPAVVVEPAQPKPESVVFVAWWVPEPMDNNGDGYRVTFRGPGGGDCTSTETYAGGVSWNVRYNHRYEHRRARVGFGPSRSGTPGANEPPPIPATAWCTGRYAGTVVFRDYPTGLRHGKRHTSRSCTRAQVRSGKCEPSDRLVGRFAFEIH